MKRIVKIRMAFAGALVIVACAVEKNTVAN